MKKAITVFAIILVLALISTVCFAVAAGTELISGTCGETFGKRLDTFNDNLRKMENSARIIDENLDRIDDWDDNQDRYGNYTVESTTAETTVGTTETVPVS